MVRRKINTGKLLRKYTDKWNEVLPRPFAQSIGRHMSPFRGRGNRVLKGVKLLVEKFFIEEVGIFLSEARRTLSFEVVEEHLNLFVDFWMQEMERNPENVPWEMKTVVSP